MPNVGRNDPCPCGSGKKYKNCCLPKVKAVQARGASLRRDDELLWARLLAFAQRPAFRVDLQSALSRFWNTDLDVEASQAMQREQWEPFLEWYVYDYHTSQDRQRIIDLFALEEGQRMGPEQRSLLAERESSFLSLFGVEVIDAEGRLEVGDLLAGGLYQVEDRGLARLAMVGDLLLGRRLGEDSRVRLSRGTVLLPGILGTDLVAAVKRAYGAYRDDHYGAGWPEFLRENGYVMYHFLLTSVAGELYERAPKREGYYNPRATMASMQAIMAKRAEAAAKQAAEEKQRQEAEAASPAPAVERTAGGLLVPGQPKPAQGSGPLILVPGRDT